MAKKLDYQSFIEEAIHYLISVLTIKNGERERKMMAKNKQKHVRALLIVRLAVDNNRF